MASTNSAAQLAVPLPPRAPVAAGTVWTTNAANTGTTTPAESIKDCSLPEGSCCREGTKKERVLLDPDVVRDIVIGLSDGLTVPFALTAGLSSIGSSKIVVLGGVAELIAGAISMGIGGFLASSAERDHFRFLKKQTHARVERSCESEMGRKVHEILGPVGIDEQASFLVANELRKVESARYAAKGQTLRNRGNMWGLRPGEKKIADVEKSSQVEDDADETGLTAFLMKFGEGMEDVPMKRAYLSAITIGSGYFFGGLVPLLPYFFINPAIHALYYSILITGCVLLAFGAVKTHFTGAAATWQGYVWGAISMLMVGGAAAGSSFGIVYAIETRFGAGQC